MPMGITNNEYQSSIESGISLRMHQMKMAAQRKHNVVHAQTKKDVKPIVGYNMEKYISRICTYACCSFESYILASCYVSRLERSCNHRIIAENVHTAILASVLVAAKFNDDVHFTNKDFARIGGLTLKQMNTLEVQLLFAIDFDLIVDISEFQYRYSKVLRPTNIFYTVSHHFLYVFMMNLFFFWYEIPYLTIFFYNIFSQYIHDEINYQHEMQTLMCDDIRHKRHARAVYRDYNTTVAKRIALLARQTGYKSGPNPNTLPSKSFTPGSNSIVKTEMIENANEDSKYSNSERMKAKKCKISTDSKDDTQTIELTRSSSSILDVSMKTNSHLISNLSNVSPLKSKTLKPSNNNLNTFAYSMLITDWELNYQKAIEINHKNNAQVRKKKNTSTRNMSEQTVEDTEIHNTMSTIW